MLIPLLALLATSHARAQTNPPGIPVLPSQAAFYSSAGATAVVEIRDSTGLVVPFTDSAGTKYSHVSVSIPAGTPVGLGWQITQTAPDATHLLTPLSSSQYSLVVSLTSGTATESPVGTYDSSVGSGNGIATGFVAPDSGTPTVLATGASYTIRAGSIVSSGQAAGLNSVSISGQTAGLALNSSLPVNVNPLALALTDSGGAGCTIGVEFDDANGVVIPLVDTNSVPWSAITVTLGASASAGLSYAILHTPPDSTHLISGLPVGAVTVRIKCLSGASGVACLAINTGGLVSGAAGTGGTGYNTSYAPNSSSPTQFYVVDTGSFGRKQ